MTDNNTEDKPEKATAPTVSDPLAMSMMKSMPTKSNSESGSSNGGNNSDNSALISFGNTSFGFNFDSEEGMSNSSKPHSDQNGGSGSDSDGNNASNAKLPPPTTSSSLVEASTPAQGGTASTQRPPLEATSSMTEGGAPAPTVLSAAASYAHQQAAASAAASLQTIAQVSAKLEHDDRSESTSKKRKSDACGDNDSGGYHSDDEIGDGQSVLKGSGQSSAEKEPGSPLKGGKKKKLDEKKREERNAREKERSFRISKQINELRDLLSSGGVIVPKGTKSSVLTEAANYIRMLQQHQYRSEIDRNQLVQQMQLIGGGAHGQQAAAAIRHFAAQNGVWSLGNFGGVPPKSAMSLYQGSSSSAATPAASEGGDALAQPSKTDPTDYRCIFNACGIGMAVASMGGAFIDCNKLFSQLSNYTKQELLSLTIFNLTSRQDLQAAFDLISQMISPPMDARTEEVPKPVVLRGALKHRNDLGLSIALVKGDDGIAKCFCVTLIKNPLSPYDTSKPVAASFDMMQQQPTAQQPMATLTTHLKQEGTDELNAAPAFTSG